MTAVYPSSVDLRSDIDSTYYQGPPNICAGYGTKSVIETMFDRSPDRKGERVSAMYLYWYGRKQGPSGMGDVGMTPENVSQAIRRYGVCPESAWGPGVNIYDEPDLTANLKGLRFTPALLERMPYVNDNAVESVKRSICWGKPVLIVVTLRNGFWNISPGTSWKTMDWDVSEPAVMDHAMAVVGYDDVSRRFLVENSWGPQNGDGGFYGIPYDMFDNKTNKYCVTQLWVFEQMPVKPVKVDGFMPGIPSLTKDECRDFVTITKPSIREDLEAKLISGGGLALRDECIRQGISDKLVEEILQLQRGEAQAWFNASNIPQGAMIWLPIV